MRSYNDIDFKNKKLKDNKFKNKALNKIEYYNYKKKGYYVIIYIKLKKLSNNFNKIFINTIDEYKLYVVESLKKNPHRKLYNDKKKRKRNLFYY